MAIKVVDQSKTDPNNNGKNVQHRPKHWEIVDYLTTFFTSQGKQRPIDYHYSWGTHKQFFSQPEDQ